MSGRHVAPRVRSPWWASLLDTLALLALLTWAERIHRGEPPVSP